MKPIDQWLLNLGSEATKRQYLHWFKRFCVFTKSTPEKLVLKARQDIAKNTSEVDTLTKRFRDYLLKEGYTEGSCQTAMFAVRSLFTWNNVRQPKLGRPFSVRFQPAFEARRVLCKEELHKMIENTESELQSLVLKFIPQSGQRRGIVSALRFSHIKENILPLPELDKVGPLLFRIPPIIKDKYGFNTNKTRNSYRFGLSDLLAREIVEHLKKRELAGENLDKDSWLFAEIGGKPLYGDKIRTFVNRAAERAGLQTWIESKKRGKMASIHAHVFRDYFKRELRASGAIAKNPRLDSEVFLDMCLGHVDSYGGAYSRISDEEILQVFKDAGPFLA